MGRGTRALCCRIGLNTGIAASGGRGLGRIGAEGLGSRLDRCAALARRDGRVDGIQIGPSRPPEAPTPEEILKRIIRGFRAQKGICRGLARSGLYTGIAASSGHG